MRGRRLMPHLPAHRVGVAILLAAGLVAACSTRSPADRVAVDRVVLAGQALLRQETPSREVEDRILALDPDRISDSDVREVLGRGPTPRIVVLHGGLYPANRFMESFGRFLVRMGYPESRIRDPGDGAWSRSPYENSRTLAGRVAWFYEHDGTRPLLIGQSAGGIQAVKVLYELSGAFGGPIAVFDPLAGRAEDRHAIVDPLTGARRDVVGLVLPYASAVGTGGAALLLPNQWNMVRRLRAIPDSVEEFVGYSLEVDLVAWDFPGNGGGYRASGKALVRNVGLPAAYWHATVTVTGHLGNDARMREWINAYTPGNPGALAQIPAGDSSNILWAADVWHSVKRHWCVEAQRFVRARRALAALPPAG